MVEEAAAACGTKNTSSPWSPQTSWPCLDRATPKMAHEERCRLESHCLKSHPSSTLIYLRCRRGRISPSSCSLQSILPFSWLKGMREISWSWEEAWVINLETAQMGGGKDFILMFLSGASGSLDPYKGFTLSNLFVEIICIKALGWLQ